MAGIPPGCTSRLTTDLAVVSYPAHQPDAQRGSAPLARRVGIGTASNAATTLGANPPNAYNSALEMNACPLSVGYASAEGVRGAPGGRGAGVSMSRRFLARFLAQDAKDARRPPRGDDDDDLEPTAYDAGR